MVLQSDLWIRDNDFRINRHHEKLLVLAIRKNNPDFLPGHFFGGKELHA